MILLCLEILFPACTKLDKLTFELKTLQQFIFKSTPLINDGLLQKLFLVQMTGTDTTTFSV